MENNGLKLLYFSISIDFPIKFQLGDWTVNIEQ